MELTDITDTLSESHTHLLLLLLIIFLLTLWRVKDNILTSVFIFCFVFVLLILSTIPDDSSGYTYDYYGETVYIENHISDKNYGLCDITINQSTFITDCRFDNCSILTQNGGNLFTYGFTVFNGTTVTGNMNLRFDDNDLTIFKNSTYDSTGIVYFYHNYKVIIENSTIDKTNIYGNDNPIYDKKIYLYNSFFGHDYYYFANRNFYELYLAYDSKFSFSLPVDYYTLTNDTYGFSYNESGNTVYNLTRIRLTQLPYANQTDYSLNNAIQYNLSVIKNGIEVYNLSGFKPNELNEFSINTLIQLSITVKTDIGTVINEAYVNILNNDTGNGYFLITAGSNNLISVLGGNLFFVVSANDSNLGDKYFELTLNSNTNLIITMNVSDTIEYDKYLIDYENELNEQSAERNRDFALRLTGTVIIVCVVIFLLWYAFFRRLV